MHNIWTKVGRFLQGWSEGGGGSHFRDICLNFTWIKKKESWKEDSVTSLVLVWKTSYYYIHSEQLNTTSITVWHRADAGFHQSVHHVYMYSMRHIVPATQIRGQLDSTAFLMWLIIQKTEKQTKTPRNQGNITVTGEEGKGAERKVEK